MNFSFLKSFSQFNSLYESCVDAEEFAITKPTISVQCARKAMEFIVRAIYKAEVPYANTSLTIFEMMTDPLFKDYIGDDTVISTLHYIRKMGNGASHPGASYTQDESLKVLEELHFLVGEYCILLGIIEDYPLFEKPLPVTHTKEQEEKAVEKKSVEVTSEFIAEYAPRMRHTRFNTKVKRDENENKKMFLHASLREAGWPIVNYDNQAMPLSAGINMIIDDDTKADYILYGRDNRPLAIVEYKTTNQNLIEGRKIAIEKADKLSQKLGYKPIVYYTNGYSIFVIDQLGFKPRRVFQFHSVEELELLKQRATDRRDIINAVIDEDITGRDYQKEAIMATCNAFASYRRSSLLVMATGTGKTRVAISLVDVLMKANWVKNVLFLADRTSLVRQAHKNFNKLLKNTTTSIYAGGSFERDSNARIIFSTYQTMINLINDDTREFGIGRFDLIIIDEAHRSIFKKYNALFHYFDSLMIGLTATPRNEDNKNTYEVFELEDGCPDYAYELETAIKEKYLVGFEVKDKTTDALRRGIHYDELSDEEKEQFEDAFATGDEDIDDEADYTGVVLNASDVNNRRVINLGTIDAMLNDLMKNGLRINGGDKLGKTIIFASSHVEAEQIVRRFYHLYGYLGPDFCKLIDSKIENHLTLIDTFGERDKMPQIAVSVDMMDTGIDVPDVLNLVFFKTVKSKIKFLQMIGRGTRLCPDIFGPGLNKRGFLILDYYDNFNFFRTTNTWTVVTPYKDKAGFKVISQSVLMYERLLGILYNLNKSENLSKYDADYRDRLVIFFTDRVRNLCNDDIEVQYNMAYVNKYRTEEEWKILNDEKMVEIDDRIIPLLPPDSSPNKVKTFDLMMYTIEEQVPRNIEADKDIKSIRYGFGNVSNKIDAMLEELTKIRTIPAILNKEPLIKKMRNVDYIFDNFSLELCESVRTDLRDLMQYIPDNVRYYIINAKDYVIDAAAANKVKEKTYVEKVQEYLQSGDAVLSKIRNLDPLTDDEKVQLADTFKKKLGKEADYASWSNNAPLLPYIRKQVGIAEEAITVKFGSFFNENVLDEQQYMYMKQIIDYTRENGDITFSDLLNVTPFCDYDVMELFGEKINDIKALINGLHKPVM